MAPKNPNKISAKLLYNHKFNNPAAKLPTNNINKNPPQKVKSFLV